MGKTGKIYAVGIGPGADKFITPAAREAIKSSDYIVGYINYIKKIKHLIDDKKILENGICVIANPISESPPIDSTSLLLGIFGAMGIGLAVVLILWGIGKRSNKQLPPEKTD